MDNIALIIGLDGDFEEDYTPEQKLNIAIIRRSLLDAFSENKWLAEEATKWLKGEEGGEPAFTFEECCDNINKSYERARTASLALISEIRELVRDHPRGRRGGLDFLKDIWNIRNGKAKYQARGYSSYRDIPSVYRELTSETRAKR